MASAVTVAIDVRAQPAQPASPRAQRRPGRRRHSGALPQLTSPVFAELKYQPSTLHSLFMTTWIRWSWWWRRRRQVRSAARREHAALPHCPFWGRQQSPPRTVPGILAPENLLPSLLGSHRCLYRPIHGPSVSVMRSTCGQVWMRGVRQQFTAPMMRHPPAELCSALSSRLHNYA